MLSSFLLINPPPHTHTHSLLRKSKHKISWKFALFLFSNTLTLGENTGHSEDTLS